MMKLWNYGSLAGRKNHAAMAGSQIQLLSSASYFDILVGRYWCCSGCILLPLEERNVAIESRYWRC
jgi:hypothetical protein